MLVALWVLGDGPGRHFGSESHMRRCLVLPPLPSHVMLLESLAANTVFAKP